MEPHALDSRDAQHAWPFDSIPGTDPETFTIWSTIRAVFRGFVSRRH